MNSSRAVLLKVSEAIARCCLAGPSSLWTLSLHAPVSESAADIGLPDAGLPEVGLEVGLDPELNEPAD